ncbi:MAG: hypothetical protein AYK19_10670 [Theionarchaea archaeon DG-70-1]|nr:MAG: hypothetical protein AYK19_10670 [Theionarchaea archaeon DG-70-1]
MSKNDFVWLLNMLAVILGFVLFMYSLSEVSHGYFAVGLLLFTLGCYWYGYRRGYGMGLLAAREKQKR